MVRSRAPRASCWSRRPRSRAPPIMPATISNGCAPRAKRSSRRAVPRHKETRRLPYTPEQMFDLVADVGRYGEFLPWVAAVRVKSDSETEMVADQAAPFPVRLERPVVLQIFERSVEIIHGSCAGGPWTRAR